MKMHSATIDILVGLFVLLGLASLAALALQVSGSSELRRIGDAYTVQAWFDNVGQLRAGAPVRVAGVSVGYVDSIRVDNERYEAKVNLRIGNGFKLPYDTSASIYTSGLLGEQYIGLEPGGEELTLNDGDTIALTSSAIVLEDLIGKFLFSKATET
ncbi:MAG: outer membrane lipid asymmetry maintenance protein MlaD [Candidatus Porifericomitaceae bacterium WSBS_2022_MAG_OTU9]